MHDVLLLSNICILCVRTLYRLLNTTSTVIHKTICLHGCIYVYFLSQIQKCLLPNIYCGWAIITTLIGIVFLYRTLITLNKVRILYVSKLNDFCLLRLRHQSTLWDSLYTGKVHTLKNLYSLFCINYIAYAFTSVNLSRPKILLIIITSHLRHKITSIWNRISCGDVQHCVISSKPSQVIILSTRMKTV